MSRWVSTSESIRPSEGCPYPRASRSPALEKFLGRTRRARSSSSTDDAAIVRKLREKAANGDVQAARELRGWLDLAARTGAEGEIVDYKSLTEAELEALTPDQLAGIYYRLVRQAMEAEGIPSVTDRKALDDYVESKGGKRMPPLEI